MSGFCGRAAQDRVIGRQAALPGAPRRASRRPSRGGSSSGSASIFATSCEVRKPSKKWRNGHARLAASPRARSSAKSCASCTEFDASSANPVGRHAMTSEWSPKIESACVATVRAATCMQKGVSSPAILYMFGIISSRPCDAVNVVASAPAWSAPWTAPGGPALGLHLDDVGHARPRCSSGRRPPSRRPARPWATTA